MGKLQTMFSVEDFNRFSKRFKIQSDGDGNGVPSPGDIFIDKKTGRPVEFNDDVNNELREFYDDYGATYICINNKAFAYYKNKRIFKYSSTDQTSRRSRCFGSPDSYRKKPPAFKKQFGQIKHLLPLSFWVGGKTDSAYYLGVHLAHMEKAKAQEVLNFLRGAKGVPLKFIQELERIAKSRGNVDLGRKLHQIFLSKSPGGDFVKLGVKDHWGDDIYVKKDSLSHRSWLTAKEILKDPKDQKAFAKAMGFYSTVNINSDKTKPHVLKAVAQLTPALYEQGVPIPAKLVVKNLGILGRYLEPSETLILDPLIWDADQAKEVFIHEVGHHVHGLMNDEKGPYLGIRTVIPKYKDGSLVFDENRRERLASVSGYGGQANGVRSGKSRKEFEDFAETFAHVMQTRLAKLGLIKKPSQSLDDMSFTTSMGRATRHLDKKRKLRRKEIKEIDRGLNWGYEYYKDFPGVQPPPKFEGNVKSYREKAIKWHDRMMNELYPASLARREKKIKWMEGLADYLAPLEGNPKRPDTHRHIFKFVGSR